MKWFISILVFFILFIMLFIVLPILVGTRDVKGPEDLREMIGCNYSTPRDNCAFARTSGEDHSAGMIKNEENQGG